MEHTHEHEGQKLTHSHEYGNLPHGYFEHDEDGMPRQSIADRLEYLRGEIRAERISYGEIAELQSLAEHIQPGDTELLEWAGVPEESPQPPHQVDAITKIYGTGVDGDVDEVYLPALGRCKYCRELIQPVVIKSSGLVDWEINGDTGCGAHPDNDDEGTCGHEPLPVAHDPRSFSSLELPE